MSHQRIVFGTDGWRGRIADTYTYSAVRRCASGFAHYIKQSGATEPVVIGHDKRFASEDFAILCAEVLAGHGIPTLVTQGPAPTPTISYAVVAKGAAAAINITASHNPASDNGFKVRDQHGGAIDPEGLMQIEAFIPDSDEEIPRIDLEDGLESGQIKYFDPNPDYTSQLHRLVNLDRIRNAGINIFVDPMWGNGANWFDQLLTGGTTRIHQIHSTRNPSFPDMLRPEPIPPNIDVGLEHSFQAGADIFLATDGDADRVGLGDEKGQFIDQLRVFALLAYYMLEVRGERGPIVKTLSTTSMLNKLGKLFNVPVHETGVGFKYVAPKMMEVDALIGGEESGGYAFRGHVPERDGILAGLYLLDMMVELSMKPSEMIELLFSKVGPHYYKRIDSAIEADEREKHKAAVENSKPEKIAGVRLTGINSMDGYKFELEDGGWLLIRFSGTEPIIRVYCETTREELVDPILEDGLRMVGL